MQHPHSLRGRRVLVVEYKPAVLEATGYLIEAAFGCKVLTASTCSEALAVIEEGRHVDLLFSNNLLPGKDGLTLARIARERRPALPVVLTTVAADEIDNIVERGYLALLEPYTVAQMQTVFTHAINAESATTAHRESALGGPMLMAPAARQPSHPRDQ